MEETESSDKTTKETEKAKKKSTVITVKNNKDFKKLVKVSDPGDPKVKKFAEKYEGRTIKFYGSIYKLENYKDYDTRYNISVNPCKYDENHAPGPNFYFKNVNVGEMNLKNTDEIRESEYYLFKCKIVEYDSLHQHLIVEPVSTKLIK